MTNEQAIKILNREVAVSCAERFEALDLAIKALQQIDEEQTTVFRYFKNKIYSGGGYTECDNCKQRFSNTGFPMIHDAKYCPECGAKVIIKR